MILKAKKTIEKINKTKFVLWKNNAIDQSDWQVFKKKNEKTQITKFLFLYGKWQKIQSTEEREQIMSKEKLSRKDRVRKNKKEV